MPWNHAALLQIMRRRVATASSTHGRCSKFEERRGGHLERGCLMAASMVSAVTTKCRGEWRERDMDCADARERARQRRCVCKVVCLWVRIELGLFLEGPKESKRAM